jgi:TRAP-type mannitol/chloroaromatic compound transport system permease small subunit
VAKMSVGFVHFVDRMNMWIAKTFGFLVIALNAVLLYGVIMRYVFHRAVYWEGDIAWLLFATFAVLAGAYGLRQGAHVRLDVIYSRFSPRGRAILDVITFPLFLFFMGLFTWFAIKKAWWSLSMMETNPMSYFHGPIYPARLALAVASVLLLLQGVAEFLGYVARIAGREIEGRVE